MSEYANQAVKQIIVCLAGCVGFAQKLQETDYRKKADAQESLFEMQKHAMDAMTAICEGLDEDQMRGVMNFANCSQLVVLPETDPRTKHETYLVKESDLETILSSATGDCEWCEKEGKEINRCQLRKALLNSGVVPAGTKSCPFKG